jgi:ssDNA thymidine ADP-ribosyltransferase, DarT
MTVPKPLRIFHITAIANLASIAKRRKLSSNVLLTNKKIAYSNIAYQGAQGKRAAKMVAKPPGGVIHDYVPFYFAPRSPMLYTINLGNVPGCPHRQQDIVHFMTTVEAVIASGLAYVFYDCNATLDIADCYNDLDDLDKINWTLFFESPRLDGYCKYFHNDRDNPKYVMRKEIRQAEFLVHGNVPLELMDIVGVYDQAKADEVSQTFEDANVTLRVEVKPEWYFRGG